MTRKELLQIKSYQNFLQSSTSRNSLALWIIQYYCLLILPIFQQLPVRMGVQLMLKVPRLLEEMYGIKSPVSKCASHLASGTIRCLCTSVTHSQQNAVNLYENLRALLQHSTHSSKGMEILDEACDIRELNHVHILNWGSKRMAGFLDACVQLSHIIALFLDTLVNWKIREDETKFIGLQDVLLLQLFADLHPVFAIDICTGWTVMRF